ncbi:MAG: glnA [Actinomycetia bacterium]|nr:glnA [Actinomycetes bacterium]
MTDSGSVGVPGFIERFGLRTDEQAVAADRVASEVTRHGLEAIRVGFADPHGLVRSKTLTPPVFASALRNGMDFGLGPFMFDTGHDLVVDPFRPGGGIGVPEVEGAADFIAVPDPLTFRVLPWAGKTGWILCDEYFKTGQAVPMSPRAALKKQVQRADGLGYTYLVGLEVEWYLTRLADEPLDWSQLGTFGTPSAPPRVRPVNAGYQFNGELYNDAVEDFVAVLRRAIMDLGLPLRTTEHESGPGQLEFTFEPLPAVQAADAMVVFRSLAKQVSARHGYHASFMCKPALAGCDASGWHLHQSLADAASGVNLFMSDDPARLVSALARAFAGGIVAHAAEACLFTTPTVNGYRRFGSGHSLAPSVAGWSRDNRGAMIRVLGDPGDPSAHLENRIGEPAANPYLYMAVQLASGLDGIARDLDPGGMSIDPHAADGPVLPATLQEAVTAARGSAFLREQFGERLVTLMTALKANEFQRFSKAIAAGDDPLVNGVSEWEQREYFRAF